SIRINPDPWEAYYRLGYIYNEMGRYKEAVAMFEKVLERQPHFPEIEKQFADLRKKLPAQSPIHKKNLKKPFKSLKIARSAR
ncbi:MAG TPA: tetratricopeptide repeat protein, partial [Nitrospiria bacterium]|nr:tetratricopeptide repeat protein [Nitrospiria bacterium]